MTTCTFDFFHDHGETAVYWPGRQDSPTRGGPDHREESIRFCQAFPVNKGHHPYCILFGEGDFTCFVTHFTGTLTAPLEMSNGTVIQPTDEPFDVICSTSGPLAGRRSPPAGTSRPRELPAGRSEVRIP